MFIALFYISTKVFKKKLFYYKFMVCVRTADISARFTTNGEENKHFVLKLIYLTVHKSCT